MFARLWLFGVDGWCLRLQVETEPLAILKELPLPFPLLPHQLTGVTWMVKRETEVARSKGGILADEQVCWP